MPEYGPSISKCVLKHLAHNFFCVVTKGKVRSTDSFALFVNIVEDLKILKDYFTVQEDNAIPTIDENDAQVSRQTCTPPPTPTVQI